MSERSIWRLMNRPTGIDFASAFELKHETIPPLRPGEVLIRNRYISMDAGTRNWMSAREDSYDPPIPLGESMIGIVVGMIEESQHPAYAKGDLVRAYGQWSDYSVVDPSNSSMHGAVHTLDPDIDDTRHYLGLLGPTAWAAYFGVLDIGRPRPGETFVVSAAAGATGSVAGQIARIAGCRTIGIVGSDEKASWITSDLGFDDALNYKTGNMEAKLRAACPNGVDVYFDNVAGPILDAVLANLAMHGRIALSGLIENYTKDEPVPGPYKFDMLLMRRATITGFFSPDFFHRSHECDSKMHQWMKDGLISFRFDETDGVANLLTAYEKLFTGSNFGKSILKV